MILGSAKYGFWTLDIRDGSLVPCTAQDVDLICTCCGWVGGTDYRPGPVPTVDVVAAAREFVRCLAELSPDD